MRLRLPYVTLGMVVVDNGCGWGACMARLVLVNVVPILLTARALKRNMSVVRMVLVLVLTVGGKLLV